MFKQIYLNMLLDYKYQINMPVTSKSKTKNDEEEDESLSTNNFVPLKEAKKKIID
jgi:hypothetical protein